MTRGRPVFSSTYATRLLVVPRSMPTMRDIPLPGASERFVDVVDDGPEVRPRRERLLERRQRGGPLGGSGRVPGLGQRAAQPRLFVLVARVQPLTLGAQSLAGAGVEPAGFRLLQRLLDLEHLLEQLRRRLWLRGGPLAGLAAFFQPHEVFDARDRVAQRPVGRVQTSRRLEDLGLPLRGRALVEVGMTPAREL